MLYISKSPAKTQKIAKQLAKTLKGGDIVLLFGEVGAGKTVFAKGFAKGLKIKGQINSPTFVYVNEYQDRFFHFDCYRVNSSEHAQSLGLDVYFNKGGICLIEWPQNILALLPKTSKKVYITKVTDAVREIEIV